MTRRRICLVTGSRAEYGHGYWILEAMRADPDIDLSIIVTGMHLSEHFGNTRNTIVEDGFHIWREIDILQFEDTDLGIAQTVGLGCGRFAAAFDELKPDWLLVFGDRYEIFSAVVAAFLLKIPVAHVHGGETTQGAVDEGLRHAITKMSAVHFVGAEDYKRRVEQLGEDPARVFHFGTPGLDHLKRLELLSKDEMRREFVFQAERPLAVVTYHPVTLEDNTAVTQTEALLRAIDRCELNVIITKSNADAQGRLINERIERYCADHSDRALSFESLGQRRYYSCMKHADIMIGNSSSGLVEAPSFDLPVVNIGDRQKGRLVAGNVILCGNEEDAIVEAIRRGLSSEFREHVQGTVNPYASKGFGDISVQIKDCLKSIPLGSDLLKKKFHDLKVSPDA